MKKIFLSLALLAATFASGMAQNLSVIDGVWRRDNAPTLTLFAVDNGTLKPIATSATDDQGRFAFAFNHYEAGFYVVGLSAANPVRNYAFYFRPGDRLDVEITVEGYSLTGSHTDENADVARWYEFMKPLYDISFNIGASTTYEEFFPMLESKAAQTEKFRPDYTLNQQFNDNFSSYREKDLLYTALRFLATPRAKHPDSGDFPAFYRKIRIEDFTGDDLLDYPYGMVIPDTYALFAATLNPESYTCQQVEALSTATGALDVFLSKIPGDRVRGEMVLRKTNTIRTYPGFIDFRDKYAGYLATDDQKERLRKVLSEKELTEVGKPAVDFTFKDIDGSAVSLSDFKGKSPVYIDVWATWCGPCKAEIPYLKKLEEEYHGKNIVFMSVSIDKTADYEKWETMVHDMELGGIQLFAGDQASTALRGPYKITGIPRFILIGRDGNIIWDDAPRPSSSEIRAVLDNAITQ